MVRWISRDIIIESVNINVLENLDIQCQTASTFQIIVSYPVTSSAWKILFCHNFISSKDFVRVCIFKTLFLICSSSVLVRYFPFFNICVLNVFSLLWIDLSRFFSVSLLGHDNFLVLFLCVLYRKKKINLFSQSHFG